MRSRYVNYDLEHGFIHNWLVAGPQAISIKLEQFQGDDIRGQIARQYYQSISGITQTPVERGPLNKGLFQVGDYAGSWNYYPCREDHLVDHSNNYSSPHYLRSWAYTQLSNKTIQEVLLVLTTHGPADVWLNGEHVIRQDHFYAQHPASLSFKVLLKKGINKILVRFEAVAMNACVHALALQVCKPTNDQLGTQMEPYPPRAGIHVTIPTLIEGISRRNKFERVAAMTYIPQDVYGVEDQIRLYWPDEVVDPSPAVVRLMMSSGRIFAEAEVEGTAGDNLFLNFPLQIPEGPYRIMLMPLAWEFYERDLRITREINLWNLGRNQHSAVPYGTFEERCQEALTKAAKHEGLFAEIAKMALNRWAEVEIAPILDSLEDIQPLELLGLVGMVSRFGSHEQFPKELVMPLESTILGYSYVEPAAWETEQREGDQILSHAVEILAGQLYPKNKFLRSGKKGQWHLDNGETRALEWLYQRGGTGFSEWDSQLTFAQILMALSHLVDLAADGPVREMSAVVMDKLFTSLAVNSFQGVFGSTHGRTYAPFVKGGFLEPTSGIARLMWGTGIFNHHIAGTVSLACMATYELPAIISNIAVSKPEEMWHRERHAVNTEQVVNKVTYKTADYMLCSAQDYFPGEKGRLEHIWQATLGAAATVFVNHPACSSEAEARQPNFWAGNARLPRVAQWKDVLMAVYHLPEDEWMGFTHAYFPIYAFDEYALKDGWAFARQGDGYLALTASGGFNLISQGYYAYRELRSFQQDNIWLCHLGRNHLDGDFDAFQEKVLALPLVFEHGSVRFTTLRGESLSFGWEEPFLRNGNAQPLSGFEHYESPFVAAGYPCRQMEVGYGQDVVRLNFENAAGSEPG